jgi:hypothetical protein
MEVALEKSLFSWDHNRSDEGDSGNKRDEQPNVVRPNGQSEHEQDERQVDGIAAKSVGTRSHDRSATLASSHRSARRAKFSEGKQEEQYGAKNKEGPERPKSRWHERNGPNLFQCDP